MVDYIPDDDTEGALRRSTRNTGKRTRPVDTRPAGRRSARLAENTTDNRSSQSGDDDMDVSAGKVVKRARTSTESPLAVDRLSLEQEGDPKVKPTEVAVESVAGKKRSKVGLSESRIELIFDLCCLRFLHSVLVLCSGISERRSGFSLARGRVDKGRAEWNIGGQHGTRRYTTAQWQWLVGVGSERRSVRISEVSVPSFKSILFCLTVTYDTMGAMRK